MSKRKCLNINDKRNLYQIKPSPLIRMKHLKGREKFKLLFTGKSKKPRCFKGSKLVEADYHFNETAYITSEGFVNWLLKLDQQMSMQQHAR